MTDHEICLERIAFWREEHAEARAEVAILKARVEELETAIKDARCAMNESGADHWAYEVLGEALNGEEV